MYFSRTIFQVCLLFGISMLGNKLVQVFHLHIPGSMLGILFIFILLYTKLIHLEWIEAGANLLIAELILFFIPSAVGVIKYKQIMVLDGLRFSVVIFLSTVTVMICTGLLAEFVHKMGRDHKYGSRN